jgi:RNA polymerase sigma-70 factor (ECF subfamily)
MGNKEKEELKRLFYEMKTGNKQVIEEIYKKYNKIIYGIAFSILKNKEDSEDIVQIFFSKLYSLEVNKLPNNNESSWIYTTTRNESINFLKKKRNNIDYDSMYEIVETNNEINQIIDKDSYNRIISKLNDIEKQIISLKILADLSFGEIGKLLNIPTGTVKWKYYKSINTLKILLSNLSMFIVTFLSSILAFKNAKKFSNVMDEEIKQENTENVSNGEEALGSNKEEYKDKSEVSIEQEIQKDENIIVEETLINSDLNYVGIGLISISCIFFIITMTFLIIFTKYQLNRRKKLSK